jgi:hypothetical protein
MAAPPTKENMSRNNSGVLAKINVPLALLWLAGFVVTVAGYLVLTSSNAAQAEFYSTKSQDFATYFSAQSGSTLGSVLIGAGVLGLLIALAAHVIVRPTGVVNRLTAAEPAEDVSDEELNLSDDELDTTDTDAVTTDETSVSAENDDESTGRGETTAEPELEPTATR